MSAGMTGLASVAKSLAVTLASVFSVSLVRNALDYGDAIQKASLKLGLSTDAFQELRYAAELSGIEMSAFSQGIQRFTRRSAEAAQGTGELAKVFKQLGIDTRDAGGNLKTSEALLGEYADAIQNAAGSGEQLRLAFKAFDSEGAGLVNLLRDGSEGLEAFRQAARDAGVILSKDLVDQSAALNDKITKLAGNLRVLLYPALIGIASVAIDAAAGLRTVAEWVGNAPDWAAWAAGSHSRLTMTEMRVNPTEYQRPK